MRDKVVRLTVVANEMEAEMVCGLLRSNGIACSYRKTDMAAAIAQGRGSMTGPTEILVGEPDLGAARKLLPQN
jgi:hypothetical protein